MGKVTREKFKTLNSVFDAFTLKTIEKLKNQGFFEELTTPVAVGKEANVFVGEKEDEKVIVKIYRLETSDFHKMYSYLSLDPRYRSLKRKRREVIFRWVEHEYRNLINARAAQVRVPTPIAFKNNVLIEQFIGDEQPAPKLKDANYNSNALDEVIKQMRKLYEIGMVHGDLSAFNILYHDEKPVFIDFSQATVENNQSYQEYWQRDMKNIAQFFSTKKDPISVEELQEQIMQKH